MDAVVYCRISHDATGEAAGVQRQETECRALAQRLALRVDAVLVDNDVSAFSGVARPAYQELLERIRDGSAGAVLAWHPDRLHRSLRELEEFIATVDSRHVAVHTVTAGDVDLTTPIGRMIARQLGTFARYESEHRSERIVAAQRELAGKGRWNAPPPYGYDLERDAAGNSTRTGRLVIVPQHARVIREAARRVIAGETPEGVCRDLNTRGIPAPRGGAWRSPSLRGILVSPTAAGLREYRGTVTGPGLWEPILTREQHVALRTRLADNRRTKGIRHAWRYLLTAGLIVCGRCGARMYRYQSSKTHGRQYACLKSNDKDGCGKTYVAAERVEALVTDAFLERIGTATMSALLANPRAFAREVQRRTDVEARMTGLAEMYAAGEIGRSEWLVARASLAHRLSTTPNDPAHLGGLRLGDPAMVAQEWARLPIDQQRSLLQLVIDVVSIMPTPHRGPKFNPDRVVINWR